MQFKDLEWKDVVSDGVTVCSHCEVNLCGIIKMEFKINHEPNETEPLPAKAGRFNMLLKQPKVVHAARYRYPVTLILSQSYQICFSLADLGS